MVENKQPEASAVDALDSQQNPLGAVDMDDFDAGFNDGMEPDTASTEAADPAESPDDVEQERTEPEQASSESEQALPEQTAQAAPAAPYQPPAQAAQAVPAAPAAPVVPVVPVVPVAQAAPVEISAEIAEEFAELAKLSPRAAELAREDSPEGAAIRDRLERLGADSAFDRAEVLLERRERAVHAANAQQQAIEAHNRNFQQVLRNEHPDLFAPERTLEQNQRLMADMRTWIEGKPYAEARGLMEIYEGGRDPRQVAALLTRFKHEAGTTGAAGASAVVGSGKKTTVDPTAMMAVAGRGAPIVPKAVGGKDDFYAGFTIDD